MTCQKLLLIHSFCLFFSVRKFISPLKALFRPILNKVYILMDLIAWWSPEIELSACLYESATGKNPYLQARDLAKSFVMQLFSKMRAQPTAPPSPSYGPPAYGPVYVPSYPGVPVAPAAPVLNQYPVTGNFDPASQSYYVRRYDVPIRKKTPIIQAATGYSKVQVQQSRSARQHWEQDKYYKHVYKPVTIVHPPEPYYNEVYVPTPAPVLPYEERFPQISMPNPLLKEEWISYYENLILSKFGLMEQLQSSTYVNCAQSYTFNIVYRILGSLVSKVF